MNSNESEFKINNCWEIGSLLDVDINSQKYFIKIEEEENKSKIIEYQNQFLYIRKQNNNFKNKPEQGYRINELVEVLNNKKWCVGSILSQKGNFYLISILAKGNQTEKFFHENFIRPLTEEKNMIKLNLQSCKRISLEIFQNFVKKENYIRRMINKFKKIFLPEEIQYLFHSNLNLYLFGSNVEEELINSLIQVSFEHFSELEAKNNSQNGNKSESSSTENNTTSVKNKEKNYHNKPLYFAYQPFL